MGKKRCCRGDKEWPLPPEPLPLPPSQCQWRGCDRGGRGRGRHRGERQERSLRTMLWFMRHELKLQDGEGVPIEYLKDSLLEHGVSTDQFLSVQNKILK